jgi:hypothetical protein
LGDEGDRAEPRRLARRVERRMRPEFSEVLGRDSAIRAKRQLAGDEQQRPDALERDIRGDRLGRRWKRDPQFFETLGDEAHDRSFARM